MNPVKLRSLSCAIAMLLSASGALAKPVTTTSETNLRQAPGTTSASLALIPKSTTIEVNKCSNGWCQVSWNGQDGFVFAKNLGMAPPRRPRPEPVTADEQYPPAPPPGYAAGPAPYYYGPYYGGYAPYYYGGWGWRGGWGWGRRYW